MRPAAIILAALIAVAATDALADPTLTLTLREHRFTPSSLTAPTGRKVTIVVINRDPSPVSFRIWGLNVGMTLAPRGRENLDIGPLKAGAYHFVDELHAQSAKGVIAARPGAKPG